jgi:hypothetical protein
MRKFIKDWKELASIPNESKTHILAIDLQMGNGWLRAKNEKPYNSKKSFMRQIYHSDVYLSTHTFYGRNYKTSSKMLRACGFDVELDNWDK